MTFKVGDIVSHKVDSKGVYLIKEIEGEFVTLVGWTSFSENGSAISTQTFNRTTAGSWPFSSWTLISPPRDKKENLYEKIAYLAKKKELLSGMWAGTNVSENYLPFIPKVNMEKMPLHILKYWNILIM